MVLASEKACSTACSAALVASVEVIPLHSVPFGMFPTLIVLAISTVLNAIYFLKTVLRIYSPQSRDWERENGFYRIGGGRQKLYTLTIVLFIVLNLIFGVSSQPILELIKDGLHHFS